MLIARAPVRVSFAGGGTDVAAYWQEYGGLVVSSTIAKYIYAVVTVSSSSPARFTSATFGAFAQCPPSHSRVYEESLPRAVLAHLGIAEGLDIHILSAVPPGTGLGSSSATAVALVQALSAFLRRNPSRAEIAEQACIIEIDELRMPIGKQDQYAAAHGGLNVIEFSAQGTHVRPLAVSEAVREHLQARLLLFFTGSSRDSKHILDRQQAALSRGGPTRDSLHRIRRLADDVRSALEGGDPDRLGELLHENWVYKRQLTSGITNARIDDAYEAARATGALGGKITGAGGGGFLLLYCPLACQEAVSSAMQERGFEPMEFHFDREGVRTLRETEVAQAVSIGSPLAPLLNDIAPAQVR